MRRGLAIALPSIVLSLSVALLPTAFAGKPSAEIPVISDIYASVVDEQDTTTFYNDGTEYCSSVNVDGLNVGDGIFFQSSNYGGDLQRSGSPSVYEFGAPWIRVDNQLPTRYEDNADCGSEGCLRVRFTQGGKTLTLDTNGTSRRMIVSFKEPCTDLDCPAPAGNPADVASAFGSDVVIVSGLLDVFLEFPYSSLGVCDSRVCPQAGNAYAKFWFSDSAGNSWRIDWDFLRVLRMNNSTWYFIADACDGSQVAGVSRLEPSKRKRPRTVFNGYYKIPFFIAAVRPTQ